MIVLKHSYSTLKYIHKSFSVCLLPSPGVKAPEDKMSRPKCHVTNEEALRQHDGDARAIDGKQHHRHGTPLVPHIYQERVIGTLGSLNIQVQIYLTLIRR